MDECKAALLMNATQLGIENQQLSGSVRNKYGQDNNDGTPCQVQLEIVEK